MLNRPADARNNVLLEQDRRVPKGLADIPDACDALVGAEAADANESASLPAGEWTPHVYCVLAGSAYRIHRIVKAVYCVLALQIFLLLGDMTFLVCMDVLSMHD